MRLRRDCILVVYILFFVYFFGGLECVGHSYAYVVHFSIFERCLDSNTDCFSSKEAAYQLSLPTPNISRPSPNKLYIRPKKLTWFYMLCFYFRYNLHGFTCYVSISDTRLRNWFALSSRVEPLWKRQDSGQNGVLWLLFFGSIFIGSESRPLWN
jgi:hypothetical protein